MLSLGLSTPPPNTLTSDFQRKSSSSSINLRVPFPFRTNISNIYPLAVSLSKSRNYTVLATASYGGEEEENERKREEVVVGEEEEEQLPAGLRADLMPKHVAVIMDGMRRWAVERDLPATSAHIAGRIALKELVRLCFKWKIKVLSVFAFSTENWSRPKEEINALLELFEAAMETDLHEFSRSGARTTVIGNRSKLPESLQEIITYAEEKTATNTGTHIIIYSSRLQRKI